MGTLTFMHDTIEGSERLLDSIKEHTHQGEFAKAQERAILLVRILDGAVVPTCLECGLALTDEEIDCYTSWCGEDAPVLGLRFEG
jgi:hypothetical protein